MRRATKGGSPGNRAIFISIHALREEGDLAKELNKIVPDISIHALREEGDHNVAQRFSLF